MPVRLAALDPAPDPVSATPLPSAMRHVAPSQAVLEPMAHPLATPSDTGEYISRLPDVEGDKPKRQRFKRSPIGFFHMDIAELQTAEGKFYRFGAIDRTSKFTVAQLVEKADRRTAWEVLEHLLEMVPYRIHTILTDNHCPTGECQHSPRGGIQFADQPRNRTTIYSRQMRFDVSRAYAAPLGPRSPPTL